MTAVADLRLRLRNCPAGHAGWKDFEDACIDTLRFLFVPPLKEPVVQPRSYSGIDRRDAVFPNRNLHATNNWGHLFRELGARLVLVEFKNYDLTGIGKDEVNQTRNYLTKRYSIRLNRPCEERSDEAIQSRSGSGLLRLRLAMTAASRFDRKPL